MIVIILVLAGLVLLVFLIGLFSKKDIQVEKEVTIDRAPAEVYAFVKMLDNQDHYNKWIMMDPNVRRSYSDADGTIGARASWDSDNKQVGKGQQEITALKQDERIDWQVRFEKPFKGVAHTYMVLKSVSNNTKLLWGFTQHMTYPSNIILLFMNIPKMLGTDVETSLQNLKKHLEK